MEKKTRRANPDTLDEDIKVSGSEVAGPGLPLGDSNVGATGSAVADYPSKKTDASHGGKSLQTETGTAGPGQIRMPPTGPVRRREK
jgi:hypothetical protein